MRVIACEADLDEGAAALLRAEPRFAEATRLVGRPRLRLRPGGFAGLVRVMTGQQVSVASADAVWSKLVAIGADDPGRLSAMDDDALKACGLSRQKLRYLRAIAEAGFDYDAIAAAPVEEAIETLIAAPGVGRWTAEIYLMFCVGRADVFAPGDLALREAVRLLFAETERPSPAALAERAALWSPWRGVAARLLWDYYGAVKGREGVSE